MRRTWWVVLVVGHALAAEPVGLEAYDLRLLPQLRAGQAFLASSADPTGGNDDRGHYARREGRQAVLLEVHRPGQLTRLWSANPQGTLRIFFDGETTPRIETPFEKLATPTGQTPFVDGWVSAAGGGVALWYPLPFKRSCKVTVEGAEQLYYQINYTLFPSAEGIETFRPGPPDELPLGQFGQAVDGGGELPPGRTLTLLDRRGAATVRRVILQLEPPSYRALAGLRVLMFWDGASAPSVDAPLLDLFASGWGAVQFLSAPVSVAAWDFFQLDFPLPFETAARIQLQNRGPATVKVRSTAYLTGGRQTSDGYFHAAWRQTTTRSGEPVKLLEATGRGQYVGTAIAASAGPDGIQYLEGDETLTVDGRTILQGTGTEDYFDGAWFFRRGPFAGPFAGAPRLVCGLSRVAAYRWHVADAIPFRESLTAVLEHGPGNDQPGARYRTVAYYYLDRPAAVPASTPLETPEPCLESAEGLTLIEAEDLAAEAVAKGATLRVVDDIDAPLPASGGKLLRVDVTAPEASLELRVNVPRVGLYELALGLVSGGPEFDYNVTLGDRPLPPPAVQPSLGEALLPLGRARLEAGPQTLRLDLKRWPGTQPSLGLDALRYREIGRVREALEAELLPHEILGDEAAAVVQTIADLPAEAARDPGVVGGGLPTEPVFSGGAQLRFSPAAAGDRLRLKFTVADDGPYGLVLGLTAGPDYGDLAVALDGRAIYSARRPAASGATMTLVDRRLPLGVHELAAGDHVLTLQPVSGTEGLRPIGVDWVQALPATRGHDAEWLPLEAPRSPVVKHRFGAEPRWISGAYVRAPLEVGQTATLTLFAPRAGRYRLSFIPARVPTGGRITPHFGAATPLDCGGSGEAVGQPVELVGWLRKGANRLTLEATAAGPGGADLALDCVEVTWLGPSPAIWWLSGLLAALAVTLWWRRRS